MASTWMSLATGMKLTVPQKTGMRLFFKPIARRFGLTKDFKDIGVID
jgi:hypothetical protein